jgi:spoIIIJ-associated protein
MTEQEQIKQQIQKLLELMGIPGFIVIEDRKGQLVFNIKSEDSKMLIGQYGQNLNALQHLVRVLVRTKGEEGGKAPSFVVDVEDYRKSRGEFLEALASKVATRVRETRQALVLKPMSRQDRWVIHNQLAKNEDLITESVGEEPERRIVIKLKS